MTDHLFSGLKVIDCASWIAGPAAATIMSDFGADVIKIEPPGAGDPWRARSRQPGADNDYYWQLTSRNKRSLALDLKHEAGRAVLYRLVADADVFVTNFPLPVRDRLKLAPDRSAAAQPAADLRLVHRLWRGGRRSGEDRLRLHRLLGAHRADGRGAGRCGYARPRARRPAWAIIPSATGLYAAIVTALYRREKTGRGGVVRSSLLQNGLWANGCFVQTRLFGEPVPHRPPREHAPNALANHYRCRDGRWFIMALFNEERQLKPLLDAIGLRGPDATIRASPRSEARKQNAAELVADPGCGVRHARPGGMAHDPRRRRHHLRHRRQPMTRPRTMRRCSAIGALVPFADGEA